jgi:CxxC-x17-CxxC domain-containing protein
MNNFKPGGIRHRRDDIGGRPRSDADYSTKNRFDKKPRHDSRGGDRSDRYENRGPKKEMELFQTTCTTCGKSCEVPFRPDGTKPVLCKECFAQKNASPASATPYGQRDRFSANSRDERKPERSYESPRPHQASNVPSIDLSAITRQISGLEVKIGQILELLKTPAVITLAPTMEEKVSSPKELKTILVKEVKPKKVATKKVVKVVAKKTSKKSTKNRKGT